MAAPDRHQAQSDAVLQVGHRACRSGLRLDVLGEELVTGM